MNSLAICRMLSSHLFLASSNIYASWEEVEIWGQGVGTKYLGLQRRAKFSPLKRLKEVIQLRFWESPTRSFPLALAPRGSYPRSGDIGQPYARPARVHRLPGGRDRSSGTGSRGQEVSVLTDSGAHHRTTTPGMSCGLRRKQLAGSCSPPALISQ